MKTIFKSLLLSLVTTTFFTSCNEKVEPSKYEGGYYLAVATVAESEDGKIYLKEDEGTTLYPTNFQDLTDSVAESIVGKRSWFEYRTFKAEYAEKEYDKTVELQSFHPTVTIKPYVTADSIAELSTFGEELVNIQYAWVTGRYLNLGFEFLGKDIDKHEFELVHKKYDNKDGKISLQLCHSETDNAETARYFIISSFDVSDFQPTETGKEATLHISYCTDGSTEKTIEIKLKKENGEAKIMKIG